MQSILSFVENDLLKKTQGVNADAIIVVDCSYSRIQDYVHPDDHTQPNYEFCNISSPY